MSTLTSLVEPLTSSKKRNPGARNVGEGLLHAYEAATNAVSHIDSVDPDTVTRMGQQDGPSPLNSAAYPLSNDRGYGADQSSSSQHTHQAVASSLGKRKRPSDATTWTSSRSPADDSAFRRPSTFDPVKDSASGSNNTPASTHSSSLHYVRQVEPSMSSGDPSTRSPIEPYSARQSSSESGSPDGSRRSDDKGSDEALQRQAESSNGAPGGEVGSERKKRQFARRTKTGCLTCRRRKKKCDEAKPVCDNCVRGKFTCGGYTDTRASLDTSSAAQSSSDHYPGSRNEQAPPARDAPRHNFVTPSHRPDHQQHHHSAYDRRSSVPWQPYPEPPRTAIDQTGKPYPPHARHSDWTMPKWSSYTPNFASRGEMPGAQAQAQKGHAASHGNSDNFPGQANAQQYEQRRHSVFGSSRQAMVKNEREVGRDRIDSAKNMTAIAQSNPNHHNQSTTITTEKDRMLTGQPYMHFTDPTLRKDRATCALLLERFNEAARPSEDNDNLERNAQLLAAVLAPMELQRRGGQRHPIGSIGRRLLVEAPFNCDYGYNIHIGDDVVIQPGCVMLDPCEISIGNRTIIGPGVKFYGMTMPMDPRQRNGARSCAIGGPIVIEEDCFIGGDVVIMPNRTIRRGSVVGAGTVVSKDVQPGTVVAGNPMRTLRGQLDRRVDSDLHAPHIQAENNAMMNTMMVEDRSTRSSMGYGS